MSLYKWSLKYVFIVIDSVADPDPDPPDPHVFGPPGSWSGSISQMYGSGSGPHVFGPPGSWSGSISQMYGSGSGSGVTSFWLFIFENDVQVPSKSNSNKQKNFRKISFLLAIGIMERSMKKISGYPDPNPDPDPLVRGMDPRIQIRSRIHPKMSWIRNNKIRASDRNLDVFWFYGGPCMFKSLHGRYSAVHCNQI